VALIGNLLIMLVAALERLFQNMRSFLLASLGLSDFLSVTLVVAPLVISTAYKEWIFGEKLCHALAFLARVLYLNTILHLCAVSYERYRAIVKDPLLYEDRITPRKIVISISLLWIPPTVVSLGPFLGWGGYEYNPMIYACGQRWDNESTFPLLIISFVVPLFIMFASNYKVVKVARRLEREVTVQLGNINNEGDNQMLQDSQNGINCQLQDETLQQEDHRQTGQAIATEEETGEEPLELFKKRLRKVELVNLEDEPNGINGERQDEAVIKACNQEEQPEKAIVERVASEDASVLCKKTLQRVEEVNLEDKHCEWDAGCGSNKKDDSKGMKRSRATKEPFCGHLHSQPPTLAMCRKNSVSPAVVQQRNPKNTKSTPKKGW